MHRIRFLFAIFFMILISGCASKQALYSWGPYQDEVYSYLKGEPPERQVEVLEKHLQESKSSGKRLPPGFYAHLGMLYSKVGRDSQAAEMFQLEQAEFPESTTFMKNLANGFRGLK
jgi:hypothetical protein